MKVFGFRGVAEEIPPALVMDNGGVCQCRGAAGAFYEGCQVLPAVREMQRFVKLYTS